ncbi:MAG: type II secretion system F family protein [Candidatus Izemoplasmataceae bacterium]
MIIYDYKYRAKRLKDGKIVKGITEAPSKAMVDKFLQEQGLKPIEINIKKSFTQAINRITVGKVIKDKDLIFYLKQLSSLLRAGVKLNEASEMLATQQTNKAVRRILYGIYYEVNSGATLADAYKAYPREFPGILVSMVAVGERTGDLKGTLNDIVDYFEGQFRLKSSIQSTMMMPIIYLTVAIAVGVVLMIFVMPQFEDMFGAVEGVTMPPMTRLFIDFGNFMKEYFVFIIASFLLFIILIRVAYKKIYAVQKFFSYIAIKAPIFGDVIMLNNLSRISNTLSQLLNNHVPLQDSLATTYDTVTNKVYKEIVVEAQRNVNNGDYMSRAFSDHYAVEVVFARMVSVGERTGELGRMLKSISEFYNDDSEIKIERLKKGLEPIMLIFIFSLVVVMLLAVMLPSLSMTSQI